MHAMMITIALFGLYLQIGKKESYILHLYTNDMGTQQLLNLENDSNQINNKTEQYTWEKA